MDHKLLDFRERFALLPTCSGIKEFQLNGILPLLSHDFCYTIPVVFYICSHMILFLSNHMILIHMNG